MIPERVPTKKLGVNRWTLMDDDGIFDTKPPKGGTPHQLSFTIEDTTGCSCEQIIRAIDLGRVHRKHGGSVSALEAFVELMNT